MDESGSPERLRKLIDRNHRIRKAVVKCDVVELRKILQEVVDDALARIGPSEESEPSDADDRDEEPKSEPEG